MSTFNTDANGIMRLATPPSGDAGQAIDGNFGTLSTLISVANTLIASINTAVAALQSTRLIKANNLSDVASASTARTNLGLGSAAVLNADNSANNLPVLSSGGKLSTNVLPAVAINQTYVVSSQAAQTALAADVGDVCVRTDTSVTYILQTSPASTFGNWVALLNPVAPVQSVAGRTGTIVLAESDITNLTSDLAAKLSLSGGTMTGALNMNGLAVNFDSTAHINADGSGSLHIHGAFLNIWLSTAIQTGASLIFGSGATLSLNGGNMTIANGSVINVLNGGAGGELPIINANIGQSPFSTGAPQAWLKVSVNSSEYFIGLFQ